MAKTFNATPRPREVAHAESVSDAIAAIKKVSGAIDTLNCFRGHAAIQWEATPSIFRQSPRLMTSENLIVRELISRYPDHFLNDNTMFDKLVRMQHFGLPTRLLDVTSNPLVALYFATSSKQHTDVDASIIIFQISPERRKFFDSDSISCICNLANLKSSEKELITTTNANTISDFHKLHAVDRLYQFIREEKPHFMPRIKKEDLFRPYYVVPKRNNPRLISQNGAFLAFGLNWEEGDARNRDIRSYLIRIPKLAKPQILKDLVALGIDSSSMFPEIDRAAAQIIESYS